MRLTTLMFALLAFLTLPTLASAQDDAGTAATTGEADAPTIQLEQSMPAADQLLDAGTDADRTGVTSSQDADDRPAADARDLAPDEAAAQQDIGSRSWWYLVGAIVVAGVVLAVLL